MKGGSEMRKIIFLVVVLLIQAVLVGCVSTHPEPTIEKTYHAKPCN